MFQKIKERIFPFLIALSALSVSASAAFYSVTGLSMLFAGAGFAVMVMAASLEVAKLVIASLLYQFRKTLPKLLKIYLTIATVVLVLITSAGIYGYLSAAYQKTADQTSIVDSKIKSLESKKKLFEETRDNILKEKQTLASLQGNLSQASTTQYTDRKGNVVVRSNDAAIRNIESASKSNEKLSSKIDIVNDSIFAIESKILEVKTKSTAESELGPLKYLSQLTGVSMDRIINWYILVIIFVFDPLAIALVIAANFAFAQLTKRKETPVEEKVESMRKVVDAYDDLKDEISKEEQKQHIIDIMKADEEDGLYDDFDKEMEEWEKASLADFQHWEENEWTEPNEDLKQAAEEYKETTPQPTEEWIIEDEEKAYNNLIQSLDRINNINSQNVDLLSKQRMIDAEIARLKEYEKALQERRKNRPQDDDTITY